MLKIALVVPTPSPNVRITTVAKPGDFLIPRSAMRRSWATCSTRRTPRASRASSLYRSTPPKARSAARRASLGATPSRSFFCCSSSMCSWSSSASSRSTSARRVSARNRRARRCMNTMCESALSLGRSHDGVDRRGEPPPTCGFVAELPLPGFRQLVELCLPVVFRRSPLRVDPAAILEAVERRIERALIDLQHVARDLLDPLRDAPAVHRLERERLENQHVERALQDVVRLDGHRKRG